MNDVKWSFGTQIGATLTQQSIPETHITVADMNKWYEAAKCYLKCWIFHDSNSCYIENPENFDIECLCIGKKTIFPKVSKPCEYYTNQIDNK